MSTEYFLIKSAMSGKAVTATLSGIMLWEINGKDNQLWFWDECGDAIRSKEYSDHVLDLDHRVSNTKPFLSPSS